MNTLEPVRAAAPVWQGVINAYRAWMPSVTDHMSIVTLHEGNTPLIRADHISGLTDCDVWLKVEGTNPTGSFKDRGMTVAVSKAVEAGADMIVCASTGNTSASAAAYAARAGIKAVVLVPKGDITLGKLAQAVRYGAEIVEVAGTFDDCLRIARELADEHPVALVNSVNDHRLAGQQTVAFEIVDALGDAPDLHCLPVGGAGNITALWRGYTAYERAERASHRPRIWGFQAAGAAPLVLGHTVEAPETVATAIRIGDPASRDGALAARDESGGQITSVSDEQILAAYRLVARHEGIFVEPASAVGIAGLLTEHAAGRVPPAQRIVITVTGNGLKDPDASMLDGYDPVETSTVTTAVARALNLA
ncbi:threonine synthase [Streptomyces sp. NPDC007164]|uniref:threonine synthase n=1 Tax=Streptomyces sp. NPDC007164 TaxID=3156918 RepID=UPI0033F6A53C